MNDNSDIQKKITAIVESYKQFYKDEYLRAAVQISQKRYKLADKYGDLTKKMITVDRPVTDIPETLFFLIKRILSEDELKYYYSKEGTRWFGKTFPEFRVTYKI